VGQADFKIFKEALAQGGCVKGLLVPGGAQFSRKDIEDLTALAAEFKAKGLAWLKFTEAGWESPIKKFFSDNILDDFKTRFKPETGAILFFVADHWHVVCSTLGMLRNHLAKKFNLMEQGFRLSWVVHFPLFQWNDEEKRLEPCHHPFTSPALEDLELLDKTPEKVRARAYDLVLNGTEIGGGSIRIHDEATQERVFKTIGITPEDAQKKFSFLLKALKFGAPPHGGIALGLDRLCALLLGLDSIREVIAFPKTQKGICPLTEAPASVEGKQLKELHIGVKI
jgi:aspartyl-tRNA synthetase